MKDTQKFLLRIIILNLNIQQMVINKKFIFADVDKLTNLKQNVNLKMKTCVMT